MGTPMDFDEALAHPEETKRRLAAGERIDLFMDGRHFAVLLKPEDLDLFEPRHKNPAAAVKVREPEVPLTVATPELLALAERASRPRGRRPLKAMAHPWPGLDTWLEENRAFYRHIRDDDAARLAKGQRE